VSGKRRKLWVSFVAGTVVGALALAAFAVPGVAQVMTDLGLAPAASDPCSVTVHSENIGDNAIQTAINAFPGGTICVGAGTFPEQLTISESGTTLKGAGATKTIIEPTAVAFNSVDWDSAPYSGGVTCGSSTCVPLAAIILVVSSTPPPSASPTTGVTIEDLQVNGAAASTSVTCGDDYVGVDFQDSAGTLASSQVLNVASPPADFGCQEVSGAVYAYNGYFYADTAPASPVAVTVSGTTVAGYQKNGITCDDPEESCTLSSNTITGIGPTTANGQNGIQLAYGAFGTVEHNTVSGNSYSNASVGGTSTNDWYANGYTATGLLLYDPATGTSVSSNTVVLNQIGIAYVDDGNSALGYQGPESITISHNTVKESNAYGIVADGAPGAGDTVTIGSNTVNNEVSLNPSVWGAPGILVDTGAFSITNNVILGTSASAGSSNGPSQSVCGPDGSSGGATGTPVLYCSSYGNLTTAAIQGASELGSNPTNMMLSGNVFTLDSNDLATLGVLTGSVNVVWV